MKLFDKIKNGIEETYLPKVAYIKLLKEKPESPQYLNWNKKFHNKNFLNSKLVDITSGPNLCLTCCIDNIMKIKTDKAIINHQFFMKKSMIYDFVTFYGTIDYTTLYNDSKKINGPKLFVLSPMGPFDEYFKEAWKLMKFHYPNCCYIPYRALKQDFKIPMVNKQTVLEFLFQEEYLLYDNIIGDKYFLPD